MPVKAKICGLTRPSDAARAVEAGASYLGVVFAGGPRLVTEEQAAGIAAAGGSVPTFGVYGDQTVDDILRISDRTGLAGAQLHGPYSRAAAATLRAHGLRVWRVVRLAAREDLDLLDDATYESDAVHVEPMVPHAMGGSGVALDRALAREARGRLTGHVMVLAGGLTSATVAEAVALVRPDVVDVSSGVEGLPGKKDREKIARFMEAVFGHSAIS
jgi:phosphoribosylanthranilate isomerase